MDYHVNLDFLPIKVVYFLYMAAFACMVPYLPVYFVHLGLTVWQIGIMRGMEPVLVFLLSPVWGAMADKFSKHKFALLLAIVGSGFFYSCILFVPIITRPFTDTVLNNVSYHNGTSNLSVSQCWEQAGLTSVANAVELSEPVGDYCDDLCPIGVSYVEYRSTSSGVHLCCMVNADWDCMPHEDQELKGSKSQDSHVSTGDHYNLWFLLHSDNDPQAVIYSVYPNKTDGSDTSVGVMASGETELCQCELESGVHTKKSLRMTYALSFTLVALSVSFNCNILAFLDAVLMQKLGKENRKDYGKHRVWGAVGWGSMAFLSGYAIDTYTDITNSASTRYEPLFVIFLLSIVVAGLVTVIMKFPKHEKPERMHQDLYQLVKQSEIIMFLFVITIEGISFGMCFSYVLIFLTSELEATHTLLGLSILVTTLAEIPVLFLSGKIIKKIGYRGVVYATLAAYALRYTGFGIIYNPWMVLPFQALHGITFGLGWPGFTHFAITHAPKGMATTLQAIMLGMYIGVGEQL
ncbi:Major facilitator superfamily domain-containing protein 6 [Holothuria leucospilota]|uniref:Major facilitator superfamily domain-containing protein 6 n=1 Tax=Holothuria leucospilota TaxID=206669 RepID=A0A9Q1BL01_HOLLE|nr:Major facilitator superfamily domain-containing protein 6 [Holothuria leucospilota]